MTVVQNIVDRFRNMNKTQLAMLAVGFIFVALFGVRWFLNMQTAAAAAAKPRDNQIPVDAAAAKREDVPIYLAGLGAVQAFYTVTIKSRVDGELQRVQFTEGQTVKKGELLAQIDPRPYQATLDQAAAAKLKDEAQLANAHADLERYVTLAPEDLASKQTVDTQRALVAQLEAQVKGDQANIDSAKTQLEYTAITSPINGRTGIRLVDPGNNIHASDVSGIVVVTQVQPITVIFTLPEDALAAINTALSAGSVNVVAMSRDEQTELGRGTLALVDNQIDQTTGTIRLKAIFSNAHNLLWPGAFVNVKVLVRNERNALTIPTTALMRGVNGVFAYVIKSDSTVEARQLKTTSEFDASTIVVDGLTEGEQVVTDNQYRLQPGSHVKPGVQNAADDHTT
jgi:membrane fusion protein, multidrug efflux system